MRATHEDAISFGVQDLHLAVNEIWGRITARLNHNLVAMAKQVALDFGKKELNACLDETRETRVIHSRHWRKYEKFGKLPKWSLEVESTSRQEWQDSHGEDFYIEPRARG